MYLMYVEGHCYFFLPCAWKVGSTVPRLQKWGTRTPVSPKSYTCVKLFPQNSNFQPILSRYLNVSDGQTDWQTDNLPWQLAIPRSAVETRIYCCKPANRDRMHQFCAAAKRMSSRCQMDNHEIFDTAYRPEFSHVLYLLLTKHYQLSSCKHWWGNFKIIIFRPITFSKMTEKMGK